MSRRVVNDLITEIPPHQISFDAEAFDDAVRSQGVRLVHYSATRCPVGMTDMDELRRPHPDHSGCTNGFLYTKVGIVTALFTGNSKHKNLEDVGFYDGSTVQVTLPREYDDPAGEPIFVAPFDRFYLEEESLVVPIWQLFIHHESGRDRLKYPAVKVQTLIDSSGLKYHQGSDFTITDGELRWVGSRPVPQLDLGGANSTRGAVCSVRYLYRPYWYVGQIVHELRVTQISDGPDRSIQRMPQAIVLHREYVALTRDQNEPGEPGSAIDADALRRVLGPSSGGFGPR